MTAGAAVGRDMAREIDARPASVRQELSDVWSHREVLGMLSRADFHVRYKRASLGVVWAVALPLLQATVLAVVFSHFINVGSGRSYAIFVLSGVLAWGYLSGTLSTSAISIVEGSTLTDKVWFPRALLPIVPTLSNTVSLGVSILALLVAMPLFDVAYSVRLLYLVPGCLLLVIFTMVLSLDLAGLHVYFRDVRFLVVAGLLVWFYLTPIVYPLKLVGNLRPFIEANPVTGIVALFHTATVGPDPQWVRQVLIAVAWTVVLLVAAVEGYRRHDRLFVDLL